MAKEVADGLRTRNIDVITTPEIGHMGSRMKNISPMH